MSLNEDDEWECDGPDCTAHLDRMSFDDEDHDDDDEEEEDQDEAGSDPDFINNDPRPREERDIPWSDMPG